MQNTHQNQFHFYTLKVNNLKKKLTIPFTEAAKRIKYLGISLPKKEKDLHTENHNISLQKIKEDTNK